MQIQDHDDLPKSDHRRSPPVQTERMVHDGPTSAADTPEAGKLGHLRIYFARSVEYSPGVLQAQAASARPARGTGRGRAREASAGDRPLYALRQGIEGTLSQAVRGFGLRCARYRGLAKAHLQHVATAAALDLDRVAAWLQGRPLAPTRISRFAALTA